MTGTSNLPENFCIMPFVNLEARTTGEVSCCCVMQDYAPQDLSQGDSILEVWNGEWLNKYRADFLANKRPEACSHCWNIEKAGMASKRTKGVQFYKDKLDYTNIAPLKSPMTLDLKLGNICNIKCRSCTPMFSSQWVKEEIRYERDSGLRRYISAHSKKGQWPRTNDLFWQELESILPTVEKLEFFGGEPMLTEQHFRILEKCVELDVAKNIDISYNTNGSTFPSKYAHLYKHFNVVQIFFSIDGVHEQFEYIRFPNVWDTVIENIQQFKQVEGNIHLKIFQTLSIFNVDKLTSLTNYMKELDIEVSYNMVHDPKYLCLTSLPLTVKQHINDKYKDEPEYVQHILKFMNNNDTSEHFDEFIRRTKFHDNFRGNDFTQTFPALYELIKYEW
jgi:MoaA/NifB/PqqE/SkfB family radical SAM enzyme